jgi:hypothetical protein
MHTVVETPAYLAHAERLFTPEERTEIVNRVAGDPECGVVIRESGGIRKVRFAFGGRGKSGGARVIYFLAGEELPIFLLAVFAKNEKSDLTPKERAKLAASVKDMIAGYRRRQ